MKVTELIGDLQRIADLDPTTEIVTVVDASDRRRSIRRVEFTDDSTLPKPIAAIVTSQRFINPTEEGS